MQHAFVSSSPQGCPLFHVVHSAFPLPTTASTTLQGALKGGFGAAVVASDTPEPCKFVSVSLCIQSLVLLQVRIAEKFLVALGFEGLHLCVFLFFLGVSKQGDKRFAELELACEADGVQQIDPV